MAWVAIVTGDTDHNSELDEYLMDGIRNNQEESRVQVWKYTHAESPTSTTDYSAAMTAHSLFVPSWASKVTIAIQTKFTASGTSSIYLENTNNSYTYIVYEQDELYNLSTTASCVVGTLEVGKVYVNGPETVITNDIYL